MSLKKHSKGVTLLHGAGHTIACEISLISFVG